MNLNWSELMDIAIATLIGAIITVTGAVLVNWLGNRKGYRDISNKIGNADNITLSGQLNLMEKEIIEKLGNKIGDVREATLNSQHLTILENMRQMDRRLQDREKEEAEKKEALSGKMYDIRRNIEDLKSLSDIMMDLQQENIMLKEQVKQLEQLLNLKNQPYQSREQKSDWVQTL